MLGTWNSLEHGENIIYSILETLFYLFGCWCIVTINSLNGDWTRTHKHNITHPYQTLKKRATGEAAENEVSPVTWTTDRKTEQRWTKFGGWNLRGTGYGSGIYAEQ